MNYQKFFEKCFGVMLVLVLLVGCNIPTPSQAPPAPSANSPDTAPQPTEPDSTASPSEMPPPTPTSNQFPNPALKVIGPEEVVFDWTHDRCQRDNLPDLPSRAFRDAEGRVQFIISHSVSFRMVGPDLDNLEMDCNPIFSSDYDADPSQFNDAEWVAAPYTEDGKTVYAVIHNEYHGWEHPGQCSVYSTTTAYFPCWYNTLTLAVSTNGGETYETVADPPGHLFASLPFQYKADAGSAGPRNPSNIIKGKDGYYYEFANVSYYADNEQWVCLMRTDDLSTPSAWRYWDGKGFNGQFIDPYVTATDNPEDHVCPALDWDDIGASLNESVTYNTYLDRYVLIGLSADQINRREVWGIYYSFSDDLIHWTRRKLLLEITLPWTAENNTDVMYLYPSLLDPHSDSRNFETTGKTAYLYYTRHNFGQGSPDRDLIRVAAEFFPTETEARQAPTSTSLPSKEPIVISVVKNGEFNVPADTPVELTLNWEAQTSQQVTDFLSAAQFNVKLDGSTLPNTEAAWSKIKPSGDRYNSQWLFPLGILSPGFHQVEVTLTLSNSVTDGLGYDYSGVLMKNTLQLEVEE